MSKQTKQLSRIPLVAMLLGSGANVMSGINIPLPPTTDRNGATQLDASMLAKSERHSENNIDIRVYANEDESPLILSSLDLSAEELLRRAALLKKNRRDGEQAGGESKKVTTRPFTPTPAPEKNTPAPNPAPAAAPTPAPTPAPTSAPALAPAPTPAPVYLNLENLEKPEATTPAPQKTQKKSRVNDLSVEKLLQRASELKQSQQNTGETAAPKKAPPSKSPPTSVDAVTGKSAVPIPLEGLDNKTINEITTIAPESTKINLPEVDALLKKGAVETVLLEKILFVGNAVITQQELEELAKPYLNRPLDRAVDIEKLREALTLVYVNRGYVNSGALIDSLNGNEKKTLTFRLVEGRITETQIAGLDGLRESYILDRLLPNRDETLNLNVLQERFQILLQDPLFQKVQSRVKPTSERGGALLDIQVERNAPWNAFVAMNNQRSASSGEHQVATGATFRNLTSFGDVLSLSASTPTKNAGKTSAYSASFSIPLPWLQTQFTVGADKGQTLVTEPPFDRLNFSNDNTNTYWTLSQNILQSLTQSISADINYFSRKSANFVDNQPYSFSLGEQNGKVNNKGYRLSASYTLRDPRYVLSTRLTYTAGQHNYYRDPRLPSSIILPQNDYKHTLWQALFNYKLTDGGMLLSLRGNWQNTSHALIGMERFSLAGSNAVRGYLDGSATYDKVQSLTAEVHVPLYSDSTGFTLKAVPFVDWGNGENVFKQNDSDRKTNLQSAGVTLLGQYKDISMKLEYASALKNKQLVTGNSLQSKGISYSLRWDF